MAAFCAQHSEIFSGEDFHFLTGVTTFGWRAFCLRSTESFCKSQLLSNFHEIICSLVVKEEVFGMTNITACEQHGKLHIVSPGSLWQETTDIIVFLLTEEETVSYLLSVCLFKSKTSNPQSGPRYSVFSAAGMCPFVWVLKVGVKSCW